MIAPAHSLPRPVARHPVSRYVLRDLAAAHAHARAERQHRRDPSPPLVAGGQGRTDAEVGRAAVFLCGWSFLTLCCLLGLAIGGATIAGCDAVAHAMAR